MNKHGHAGFHLINSVKHVIGRQRLDRKRGSGLQAEFVGQEYQLLGGRHGVFRIAVLAAEGGYPPANESTGDSLANLFHNSGRLEPRCFRKLRLARVAASSEQRVGKVNARHVDSHQRFACPWVGFLNLLQFQDVRTANGVKTDCLHT